MTRDLALTVVDTVARLSARPGPASTRYYLVVETGRVYRWTLGDTSEVDDVEVLGHTLGEDGRWLSIMAFVLL